MGDTDYVMELLRVEYNNLDGALVSAISPARLADVVYKKIDPRRQAPVHVQVLAILELRQLARGICAAKNREQAEEVEKQGQLFEQLQKRYPVHRKDDDVYVLLKDLTLEEANFNIARLRHEAEAKNAHADALQAYVNKQLREGKLGSASTGEKLVLN